MPVGYARVSTAEQNVDLQTTALHQQGCERIWVDHGVSGMKAPLERPEFADLWRQLHEGDVIVIYKLDRLARNARAALEVCEAMTERGVALLTLDGLSTEGAVGKLVLTVMAAVSELEVSNLREGTKDGLRAAVEERGVTLGRKPALTAEQVAHARELHEGGRSIRDVARLLGVGKSTIGRALRYASPS